MSRIAAERMKIDAEILPKGPLPRRCQNRSSRWGDSALSEQIRTQVGKPFWIDTVGRSNLIEIRILLDDAVLRVFAHRTQAYASNSWIFLTWMTGTAVILMVIALLYLRNQIKPIRRLANAAEAFGKGRDVHFRASRCARGEAGRAGLPRHAPPHRTRARSAHRKLNGVSHDLRTILTRFRLSLALEPASTEAEALTRDVTEMERMLEAYLAFARGDAGKRLRP